MEDHLDDKFLQDVVDHLVAAGFSATNEQFNYTFSVDLYHGVPVKGSRSVLFGLANPTWGGSVSVCTGHADDGVAFFDADESDSGYVEAFILDEERDPRVVATGIALALVRDGIKVAPWAVEQAIEHGEASYQ